MYSIKAIENANTEYMGKIGMALTKLGAAAIPACAGMTEKPESRLKGRETRTPNIQCPTFNVSEDG